MESRHPPAARTHAAKKIKSTIGLQEITGMPLALVQYDLSMSRCQKADPILCTFRARIESLWYESKKPQRPYPGTRVAKLRTAAGGWTPNDRVPQPAGWGPRLRVVVGQYPGTRVNSTSHVYRSGSPPLPQCDHLALGLVVGGGVFGFGAVTEITLFPFS
eukprot:2048489-Rhodomonas_salina.1